MYRSKLFKRNNGGKKKTIGKGSYSFSSPRMVGGWRAPNPRPMQPYHSINRYENKALTGTSATIALKEDGQCFHLDQVARGTQLGDRLGQKHQVTAVHIRGRWEMPNSRDYAQVGYMLVWDRQPGEALAAPGDILALTGVDSYEAFPNQDNNDRFIILSRKMHNASNALTSGAQYNDSAQWVIDDYFQFRRQLIATSTLGGAGTIADRVSGALILVGLGNASAANSANLTFSYRLYFQDV